MLHTVRRRLFRMDDAIAAALRGDRLIFMNT